MPPTSTAKSADQGRNASEPVRSRKPRTAAPKVYAKVVTVKTRRGTFQRIITYTCDECGEVHRVTEYGLRVTACRNGLIFVVAGGER